MYTDADDSTKEQIISQLYPKSNHKDTIKQVLDQYLQSSPKTVLEPKVPAAKQLKNKKLAEMIRQARPLLKEASVEKKVKFLKLLKEYAIRSNEPDEDDDAETFFKFAKIWYNGNDSIRQSVEQTLASVQPVGYEIGEIESEEGGAFVVQSGDEHGDTYLGWSEAQLTGVAEGFYDQTIRTRNKIAQQSDPTRNKFVWKRPSQISGSHTEQELSQLGFRKSTKNNVWGGTQEMWNRLLGSLNELAPSTGGEGDTNYLKTLASAWYNMDWEMLGYLRKQGKNPLEHRMNVQDAIENILYRGIHCPDGKVRKYFIGYNVHFDGVEIQSKDHYEYGDNDDDGNDIDGRTGKPWGPYDAIEFAGNELNESVSEDLNELAPGGNGGDGDERYIPPNYGKPYQSKYLGKNEFEITCATAPNDRSKDIKLKAVVQKYGLEWEDEENYWFLDSPGAVWLGWQYGEIPLPKAIDQVRNPGHIHDLVSDWLNSNELANLQQVAINYFGFTDDGEMNESKDYLDEQ